MQLYLKLAVGNVRRSARDYSVYFATLGFAACLLYSFVASTDYLVALGLSTEQMGVLGSAGDILQAFSVFTVLVFLFLVRYANRFLLRRRKREFALYELCGMGRSAVSVVLVAETALVGAGALACGLAAGAALSPAFGAVAAFVFDAPWRLAFSFSPDSAAWTAGCFAVVFAVNAAVDGARDIARRPLAIELMSAERAPERMRLGGQVARGGQAVLAAVLHGSYGARACFNRCTSSRLSSPWASPPASPRRSSRAWAWPHGVSGRAGAPSGTGTGSPPSRCGRSRRACPVPRWRSPAYCVLVAVAVCMMVAGFVFSIGPRTPEMVSAGIAASMAPIGYIGIFYGAVFLLSAVAVLALQQLSGAVDARRAYGVLGQLGCDRALMRASVRRQLALYFAAPLAGALVHDVFGLFLVAFLAFALGAEGLFAIVAGVLAFTVGLMAAYGAITARAVERVVLSRV